MPEPLQAVPPREPLIEVQDLEVSFPGRREGLFGRPIPLQAVSGLSFQVARGEAFGVVGESGSGKTTVLRALVGLYRPTAGRVRFEGRDMATLSGRPLKEYRRRVHMVFQNPYTAFHPRMTVEEALLEPLVIHGIGTPADRRERIAAALQQVGMTPDMASRYPNQFSGGQRQRLGLARALVLGAEVLLLDEPVSALDVSIQAQVLNLLQDLKVRLGLTYVVIAHDLAVVRYLCDRVAIMRSGRFVEMGGTADLYANPGHPYTRALMSALPTIKRGVAGQSLPEVDPGTLDAGGRLTEVTPGHFVATNG